MARLPTPTECVAHHDPLTGNSETLQQPRTLTMLDSSQATPRNDTALATPTHPHTHTHTYTHTHTHTHCNVPHCVCKCIELDFSGNIYNVTIHYHVFCWFSLYCTTDGGGYLAVPVMCWFGGPRLAWFVYTYSIVYHVCVPVNVSLLYSSYELVLCTTYSEGIQVHIILHVLPVAIQYPQLV